MLCLYRKRFITTRIVGISFTTSAFITSSSISVELKQTTQSFSDSPSTHWKTFSYSSIGVCLEQRNNVFSRSFNSWFPLVSIICMAYIWVLHFLQDFIPYCINVFYL